MTTPISVPVSRRSALGALALAPAIATGIGGLLDGGENELQAVTSTALLGSITSNDPASYVKFANFLGKSPPLAMLGFNQMSPTAFASSIAYICAQGALYMTKGAQILWSVPFPGAKQLENVVAGTYDATYKTLFTSILSVSPGSSTIYVRLPWEFNLPYQENAAIDRNGAWNPTLWVTAYNRLAWMAKVLSSRFKLIWCPNVTTMGLDPQKCWPGPKTVDIIAQDFYMSKQYNQPGCFSWFLNENRGLNWGAKAARTYGKQYALTEWGMDHDAFVPDFNAAATWFKGLGTLSHHHCWWDRSEVIDCRISDGTHPKLAAAYKGHFA